MLWFHQNITKQNQNLIITINSLVQRTWGRPAPSSILVLLHHHTHDPQKQKNGLLKPSKELTLTHEHNSYPKHQTINLQDTALHKSLMTKFLINWYNKEGKRGTVQFHSRQIFALFLCSRSRNSKHRASDMRNCQYLLLLHQKGLTVPCGIQTTLTPRSAIKAGEASSPSHTTGLQKTSKH